MADPNPSVAAWATVDDVCAPCDGYDFNHARLEDTLQAATDVLYVLSGRQFPGIQTETLRPCSDRTHRYRTEDPALGSYVGEYAYGFASRWRAFRCPHRGGPCGCARLHELNLGISPLVAVTEVKIDGDVLDAASYRVDDRRWLVRLDGEAWPSCQDLAKGHDEEGAFAVTVEYGTPPPEAGVRAAAALGCQMALACDPSTAGECKLPKRVTNLVRQGVTMAIMDPMEFLDQGKTGVYEADLFIKAFNPQGITSRAAVLSPDLHRRTRRVGT